MKQRIIKQEQQIIPDKAMLKNGDNAYLNKLNK